MPLINTDEQLEKVWAEMPARFGFPADIEKFWRRYKCWPEHYSCKRLLNKIHSILWQYGINPDTVKTFRNATTRIISIPWMVSFSDIKGKSEYKDLSVWLDNKWNIELFPANEINTYFPADAPNIKSFCTMILTEVPQKRKK